ncbi:replication initiator protein A, partial [Planctomycetota bacterium]
MVGENTKLKTPQKTPLLPDRHPIDDFFICDVTEAIPKNDLGSMEHPVYSLSTKPDTRIREYEHNGVKITVAPSALGLATIHDKDILIYCISQLIAKMNAGEVANKVLVKSHQKPVQKSQGHSILVGVLHDPSGLFMILVQIQT